MPIQTFEYFKMSSVGSAFSDLLVSYCGEEVYLEQALDDIFKRIQEFHNDTHCSVRELAMMPEQDDDYMQSYKLNGTIDDRIGGIVDLMKELRSICKQILGPVPKECKEEVAKLKDGNGQYIWDDGLRQEASIPRLCGFPVNVSEDAPSTMTAGLYVAILGDFSKYYIAESLDITIQVLVELYAETNQNGYILRYEGDGMPVLEEAFTRLKMGA